MVIKSRVRRVDNSLHVYTDGSANPNPGFGGWAYCIPSLGIGNSGGTSDTTNNRMELMAILQAIAHLKKIGIEEATIFTDSKYAVSGITTNLSKWVSNSYISAQGVPVKNKDIWEALYYELQDISITMEWVKGHSGNEGNEKVDEMAECAREAYTHNYLMES